MLPLPTPADFPNVCAAPLPAAESVLATLAFLLVPPASQAHSCLRDFPLSPTA